VKYEVTLLNGSLKFVEASSIIEATKKAGVSGPVVSLKCFVENNNGYDWVSVPYKRRYQEVTAYINAWNEGKPVASSPIQVTLESYESIKEVTSVVNEKNRILAIWPNATIKIQRHFLY
jgi:hypothetical protein